MSQKILIVEDEENIARFVELELLHEGYEVDKAFDGRTGLEKIESLSFDLVLLDLMLPQLSGMEVLRRARQISDVSIILLTARDTVIDKVSGLDGGADDYITKPFDIEELLARVRVCLRKKGTRDNDSPKQGNCLGCGDLLLNADSRTVTVGDIPVELTRIEFDLLHYLLLNQNIALSRDTLVENVWGYNYDGSTNTVDVYIRYLRAKIEEPFGKKYISTIRGVGYVIKNDRKN